MAYRRGAPATEQRGQRDRAYAAAEELSNRYPGLAGLEVDLRFTLPDGKPLLSPYRQIYTAGMQAYFDLQCPTRDCADGGFDLTREISRGAASGEPTATGTARCTGMRGGGTCGIELTYLLTFERERAARRA